MSESSTESDPLLESVAPGPNGEGTSSSDKSSTNSPNYAAIKSGTEMQDKIIQELGPHLYRRRGTNWWAILMTVVAGAFLTSSAALVKVLDTVSSMQLLGLRSLIQVVTMLLIAAVSCKNPFGPPGYRILLTIQGIFGGLTMVLLFVAFRQLPVGDAAAIVFSAPVFVLLFSFVLLREECKFLHTFIVFLLMTGVILVAQPPLLFSQGYRGSTFDGWGYAAAVTCSVFTAVCIVLIRKIREVHYSVIVLNYSFWSLKYAVAMVLFPLIPLDSGGSLLEATQLQWGVAGLIGLTGVLGEVLMALALNREGAGKVAVARSFNIIFAFVLQVTYWGEVPNWVNALGAVLVCVSVLLMGIDEQISRFTAIIP